MPNERHMSIMQAHVSPCAFAALAVTLLCSACNDSSDSNAPASFRQDPLRIIELEGPPAQASYVSYNAPPGGLVALGDIDADGFTDLAVGVTYGKTTGHPSSPYRGSLTAFSGKDGHILWQVRGKTTRQAKAEDDKPYFLGEIAPIGDVNGDTVVDIYVLEEWTKRTFLIFSGKTGKRLLRQATPRRGRIRPLRVHDITADGRPDLIFRTGHGLELTILSGTDFSTTQTWSKLWPGTHGSPVWMTPQFADFNADGTDDYLVRRWHAQRAAYMILSGKDFSQLATFDSRQPRVIGTIACTGPGDLDRDRMPDLVISSSAGAGPSGHTSFLHAVSANTGAVIWEIAGNQMPAGAAGFTVDAKTGKRTDLAPDVGFGAQVLTVPDLNHDAIAELATIILTPTKTGRTHAINMFSGADGSVLATVQPDPRELRFPNSQTAQQMILLDSVDNKRHPGLAAYALTPNTPHTLAIFALPAH